MTRLGSALALGAFLLLLPSCRRSRVVVRPSSPLATQTLSAAQNRTCVLHQSKVTCVGQLGSRVSFVPVSIPGTEGALAIDDGGAFACVIRADRTVACFGERAVPVPAVNNAVQLAVGRSHGCARLGDGHVNCWAANAAAIRLPSLDSVTDLAAHLDRTCAVRRDGSLWCWSVGGAPSRVPTKGRAVRVTLAPEGGCVAHVDGSVRCFSSAGLPMPSPRFTRVRDLAFSDEASCLLDDTGAVSCWTPTDPTLRPMLDDVSELVAAYDHVCARRKDGEVRCWGDDSFGQLGDRDLADAVLRRVEAKGRVVMGGATACAVGDDVRCWTAGPLSAPPAVVANLAGTKVLARGRDHSCAIDQSSALRCFGLARVGQLGRMPEDGGWAVAEPTRVPELPPVVDVTVGDAQTCARAADGRVWCFGSNASGELALGTSSLLVATPTPVPALTGVSRLALGAQHLCALFPDGTVSCSGSNGTGQLGHEGAASSPILTKVAGLDHVADVQAVGNHTCVRRDDGEVRCWGMRFRDPDGPYAGKGKDWFDGPQPVTDKAISLAIGRAHACLVREGGEVFCWGDNQDGSCGAPIGGEVATPRLVTGIHDAVEVFAGEHATCARTKGLELWCWGGGNAVGAPETITRTTPVRMRL